VPEQARRASGDAPLLSLSQLAQGQYRLALEKRPTSTSRSELCVPPEAVPRPLLNRYLNGVGIAHQAPRSSGEGDSVRSRALVGGESHVYFTEWAAGETELAASDRVSPASGYVGAGKRDAAVR